MVNAPSPQSSAIAAPAVASHDWLTAGAALLMGLALFAWVFHTEVATALYVWGHSDAYNHCFLVLPVAAYLAWQRRDLVRGAAPRPAPWIAFLALPAAAAWFVADQLGIMEARQLVVMSLVEIMVAALLGWRIWRAFSAPLLYLFFLVPFGEFVVAPLQSLVVHFTTAGLTLLGIPNFSDGITIQIPEGTFLIHQACSGLRFLIASAAFGALYACVMYRSPLRRAVFIALSLVIAVIGNCLRVLGITLIAHFIGNTQAIETDHVLWGWLFYVMIGAVLIMVGLAFRQEPQFRPVPPAPQPSINPSVGSAIALALVVFFIAMPSMAADYLEGSSARAEIAAPIEMPEVPGCEPAPLPAWAEDRAVEDGSGVGVVRAAAYRCGGAGYVLSLRRYPPRMGARPLFLSVKSAIAPAGWDIILQSGDFRLRHGSEAPIWRITEGDTEGRYAAVATALWIDGRPSGAGIAGRLGQALNALRPSAASPVLLSVTYLGGASPTDARRALARFIAKIGSLPKAEARH